MSGQIRKVGGKGNVRTQYNITVIRLQKKGVLGSITSQCRAYLLWGRVQFLYMTWHVSFFLRIIRENTCIFRPSIHPSDFSWVFMCYGMDGWQCEVAEGVRQKNVNVVEMYASEVHSARLWKYFVRCTVSSLRKLTPRQLALLRTKWSERILVLILLNEEETKWIIKTNKNVPLAALRTDHQSYQHNQQDQRPL